MATYHNIYVTTKVQNRKKNESYMTFDKCKNAREVMSIDRMAGKVKDFIADNCLEQKSQGEDYNGYGWGSWRHSYLLAPSKVKELQALVDCNKSNQAKRVKTDEEKEEAWAKRLAKLTGISIEKAKEIALEKLNAKTEQWNQLCDRQFSRGYSVKRSRLMHAIDRSNPLRYIKDKDHAMAILAASYRHNCTDYDGLLEDNRWEAQMGNMDYEEVRSDARAKVASEVAEGVKRMVGAI